MNDTDKKLNVLPGLTAAAVLLGIAALVAAIVAIGRTNDKSDTASSSMGSGQSMSGMTGAGMSHMAPLPEGRISNAPSDQGGTPLKGTLKNGVLELTLDARPVWWRIYGKQRLAAYAYNGIVPGPEIRVRNGQRVRIRFTNDLPVETTIHWHGIGVPSSQDGVPGVTQQAIKPGKSYTYEFTARPAGDPNGGGTFLYHTHVDEDRQMPAGLYGSFVIDPASPTARYAVDRTLVFSEWTADAATGRVRGVMQMEGMLPNFFTINGKSYPDTAPIDVPAGKPVMLRLVNAGQMAHPIHLHGTAFRVVARDGHPIPRAQQQLRDTISLESGERADIAFTAPPGKWLLHCHIGHHLTNDGDGAGGLITVIRST
jgi:manganese oxidase